MSAKKQAKQAAPAKQQAKTKGVSPSDANQRARTAANKAKRAKQAMPQFPKHHARVAREVAIHLPSSLQHQQRRSHDEHSQPIRNMEDLIAALSPRR